MGFFFVGIVACSKSGDDPVLPPSSPTPPQETDNTAPGIPILGYPEDSQLCVEDPIGFQWSSVTDPDGDRYVGGWKEDRKHGKGKQIFANGKVKEGVWTNGKFGAAQAEKTKDKESRDNDFLDLLGGGLADAADLVDD